MEKRIQPGLVMKQNLYRIFLKKNSFGHMVQVMVAMLYWVKNATP
jgi:hypothetical protein